MKYSIIEQEARMLTNPDVIDSTFPELLEYAGRVCTATEHKTGKDSHAFIKKLLNSKHMSVLEHCCVTVELTTSRAITHQLVRHRIAAYSQQSMRYVKYTVGDRLAFIKPHNFKEWEPVNQFSWEIAMQEAAERYDKLIFEGLPAEQARGILPHDTATKLIATWNLRELLHVLYDPCRMFKAGDKVRIVQCKGRDFNHEAKLSKGKVAEVLYDEVEGVLVSIFFPGKSDRGIDPVYLELVTPVEERMPRFSSEDYERKEQNND